MAVTRNITDQNLKSYREQIAKIAYSFKNKEYSQAVTHCEKVLRSNKSDSKVWNMLGTAHAYLGNLDKAEVSFSRATKLDTNFFQAFNNLGNILRLKGKFNDALVAYETSVRQNPKSLDSNYNLGLVFLNLGQSKNAIKFFEKTLEIDARFSPAHFNLATAYELVGATKKAILHYKKAIEINPRSEEPYIKLSNIYTGKKLEKKALALLKEAIISTDPSVRVYIAVAKLQKKLGDFEGSVYNLQKAESKEPENITVMLSFCDLYAHCKNIENLNQYCNKALNLDPENISALFYSAISHKLSNNNDLAIAQYKKICNLDQENAQGFFHLAQLYRKMELWDQARDAIEFAFKLDTQNVDISLAAAEIYMGDVDNEIYDIGDLIKAEAILMGVLDSDKENLRANFILGQLSYKTRNYEFAAKQFKFCRTKEPNNTDYLINLAISYQGMELHSEAVKIFNKVLDISKFQVLVYINAPMSLLELGKVEQSFQLLNEGRKLFPENIMIAQNELVILSQTGASIKEIEKAQDRVFELNPNDIYTLTYLENFKKWPENRKILFRNKIENLLKNRLSDNDKEKLLHSKAIIKESENKLSDAYDCYSAAGSILKRLKNYDIEIDKDLFASARHKLSGIMDLKLKMREGDGVTPIFIVGMPRSGTTLLEQMLSKHEKVKGLGELKFFLKRAAVDILNGHIHLDDKLVEAYRRDYLDVVKPLSGGKPYVIDKMPSNFIIAPLLKAVFPESKVIHISREPRAVCWSNFTTRFADLGLGYACVLSDTVQYYQLYLDLMENWRSLMGKELIDIDYASLVNDPEAEMRILLGQLDLAWQDDVTDPRSAQSFIKTASLSQANQQIYKNSSDKWRKYEKLIKPLFDVFET